MSNEIESTVWIQMSYTSSTPSESVLLYCEVLLLFVLLLPLLGKFLRVLAAVPLAFCRAGRSAGLICPQRYRLLRETYWKMRTYPFRLPAYYLHYFIMSFCGVITHDVTSEVTNPQLGGASSYLARRRQRINLMQKLDRKAKLAEEKKR